MRSVRETLCLIGEAVLIRRSKRPLLKEFLQPRQQGQQQLNN
jgi:hypothetical protein